MERTYASLLRGKTYADVLRSFPVYLIFKWQWLKLPPPTELQLEIAEFLQECPTAWSIIKGFRGIAKSWITGSYAEWCWLKNRDFRVMIVSGNQTKADEISLFIRQCIDGFPLLEPLRWADWEKQHVRWGIQQFNVKGSPVDIAPSCKACGIQSMLVGSRAHLIIGDDVETPQNSDTVESRDKLLAAVGEFSNILLPNGQVKLLGTPQTEESIYLELENRGVTTRVWPARVPTEDTIRIYKDTLSPKIQSMFDEGRYDEPTEPSRFDEEVLMEKAAVITRSAWRLQFMLDTTLADAERYPLKLHDLMVTACDPISAPLTLVWNGHSKNKEASVQCVGFSSDYLVAPLFIGEDWKPYERIVMAIDPSGRGSDESAWVIVGTLAGRFYVLDWGGFTDGYASETKEALVQLAMTYKVNEVIYEANFGDGMYGTILRPAFKGIYDVGITEVKHSKQKEARILDTLEPVIRSHRVILDVTAAKRDATEERGSIYSLMFQMSRLTRERGCLKHDDRLDALAIAVAHLQSSAGVNTEQAAKEIQTKVKLNEIKEVLSGVHWFGQKPKPTRGSRQWRVQRRRR